MEADGEQWTSFVETQKVQEDDVLRLKLRTGMIEPQTGDTAALPFPRTTSTASFLKHTVLSPAQKEYLQGVAASRSAAYVHDLISRHYMNVMRRGTPPECCSGGGDPARTRADADALRVEDADETQAGVCPEAKSKNKSTRSKSDRTALSFRFNASKRRKPQKKSSSTSRPGIRRLEEDEEEELDDSLSLHCIGEWDDSFLESIH